MFYWLWLKRVLLTPKNIFQFSVLFSLFSLVLGVAALTTAVLAVNGFSLGLEKAIVDMSGHIIVSSKRDKTQGEVLKDISRYDSFVKERVAFLSSEALILRNKRFKGLLVEGVEDSWLKNSPLLQQRILKGGLDASKDSLIVGKSLARELRLEIGSAVPLIVSGQDGSYFSRKQKMFKVGAIGDFGRHDFNSRFVLAPLSALQILEGKEGVISGARLWLKDSRKSERLSQKMRERMTGYRVYFWKDLDRGFFEVIDMDKKIIFLVLMILILAAGFNVSSSLFIQVYRKTKDISVLRSMGGGQAFIRNLFLLSGFALGFVGTCLGLLLGWGVCSLLIGLQDKWNFIPEEIYQVNQIILQWRARDLLFLFFSSLTVVLLSSILPARRACKLPIKEALSHD